MNIHTEIFFGNTLNQWMVAGTVSLTVAITLLLTRFGGCFLARRLNGRGTKSFKTLFSAIGKNTSYLFIVAAALYSGSLCLVMATGAAHWIRSVAMITLLIQIGLWINGYISALVQRYERLHLEAEAGKVTTFRALAFVGRIFIFTLVLVVALDQLPGVKVSALIASLGVGGIAIALALQNILADLFASLSISLDKPFALGDFIIVDNCLGTVESIGLKTTRIRSLSGEQLVFSNNDLLKSRIRNYKRMQQRRVPFTVGVTYQTPPEKLRKIPDLFKKQLELFDDVHFDRAHFKEYAAYSLNFEFVYFIHTSDYTRYMDIQQAINLGLYEAFEAEGIEFAYPTQKIYVDSDKDEKA